MEDSQRTDDAFLAIYAELVTRSLAREGQFFPVDLDQQLEDLGFPQTLRQALFFFVHAWDSEASPPQEPGVYAQDRRDYARQIAETVLAQRTAKMQIYLPLISIVDVTSN
jgi:hypothetical protein